MNIRPIAIYLPQFHPIPENDAWWGKGFTEWTNVVKAKPLFKDHYQPHLPADLGFYDLRLDETRIQQAELAKEYGINGFCYYHYWFNGRRLLNRPLDDMLKTKTPDFPFMLCWANENWTRKWDGRDKEILTEQHYSTEDDENHIRFLIEKIFCDKRYIRINNKPVIAVYKSFLLPDARKTVITWRRVAQEYDMELYICNMCFCYHSNDTTAGFNASIDFEPFGIRRQIDVFEMIAGQNTHTKKKGLKNLFSFKQNKADNANTNFNKVDYDYYYTQLKPLNSFNNKIFPSLMPGWDNSSRTVFSPLIVDKSTPDKFKTWLKIITDDFIPYSKEENLIFINAWNEWAEGNHLEPCSRWEKAYLEAIKEVLLNNENETTR